MRSTNIQPVTRKARIYLAELSAVSITRPGVKTAPPFVWRKNWKGCRLVIKKKKKRKEKEREREREREREKEKTAFRKTTSNKLLFF
jgi:hypothetical protein